MLHVGATIFVLAISTMFGQVQAVPKSLSGPEPQTASAGDLARIDGDEDLARFAGREDLLVGDAHDDLASVR